MCNKYVRVGRPQLKGYSKSQPFKIVEVIGPGTYKLEDSSVWNGSRLCRYKADRVPNNTRYSILDDIIESS
ncbi:hypothetical protein A3Q56_07188 [Intoshia linei]|uniref:Uncharacterized protein n=1 Tax=Intoshia linei TaxID=1819745 RepID=A0A177ASW1_9BILA|nr:hypothetical protein A3Q56_07188 [Intoshia linei]